MNPYSGPRTNAAPAPPYPVPPAPVELFRTLEERFGCRLLLAAVMAHAIISRPHAQPPAAEVAENAFAYADALLSRAQRE